MLSPGAFSTTERKISRSIRLLQQDQFLGCTGIKAGGGLEATTSNQGNSAKALIVCRVHYGIFTKPTWTLEKGIIAETKTTFPFDPWATVENRTSLRKGLLTETQGVTEKSIPPWKAP